MENFSHLTISENHGTLSHIPSHIVLLTILLFSHSLNKRLDEIERIDEWDTIADFFSFLTVRNRYLPSSQREDLSREEAWQEAPDICIVCYSYFGETIGGRLRKGCPSCRRIDREKERILALFQHFTGLRDFEATMYLSQILFFYYVESVESVEKNL